MWSRRALGCALAVTLLVPGSAHAQGVFPLLEPPEAIAGGGAFALLDFDGDGETDLAGLRLVEGIPTAYLLPASGPSRTLALNANNVYDRDVRVAAGDVTGDGRDDLVVALDWEAQLLVLRGRADGALAAPDVHPLSRPGYIRGTALALGDLDGDGDLDAVAALRSLNEHADPGAITVLANDGDGGLSAEQTLAAQGPADLALVALAGDGDLDLVVAQHADASVRVFAGAGGVAFGAPATYAAGLGPSSLAIGDFDVDGRADVAVGHEFYDGRTSVAVLAGTSAAAGLAAPVVVPGAGGGQVAVGDLDLDGRDDVYVADPPSGYAEFVRGLGGFAFAEPVAGDSAVEGDERAPLIADVDGDGKPDVLTSGSVSPDDPGSLLIRYGAGPQLVPDPSWVRFDVGSPVRTVTFTNAGGGVARAIERDVTGDVGDFPLADDTCATATLAVGRSCSLTVRFTPTDLGFREAYLTQFAADSELGWTAWMTGSGGTGRLQPPGPVENPRVPPRLAPSAPPFFIVTFKLPRPTLRELATRGLRFTQQLPAGTVRWTLKYRNTVIASASRTLARGPRTLTKRLRPTAAGRRLLARKRPAKLVLHTRVTAGGRTVQTAKTTVRVKR